MVVSQAAAPLDRLEKVGVAIHPRGGHVGFLYRVDHGPVRLLHLRFHLDLADEPAPSQYLWGEMEDLEEEDRAIIVGALNAIALRRPHVPYGLTMEGISFDPNTGDIRLAGASEGLTCATFLLAVLASLRYFPIDATSWPPPQPEDLTFQQWVVDELRRKHYFQRAIAVGTDIGAARFSPKPVVGALTTAGWPHPGLEAANLAAQITADLAA